MKKSNLLGYSIIGLIYLILFITVLVFILEVFKIGTYMNKNQTKFELHNTDYYGEKILLNPYKKFDVKYLHPYLIWSMPWKKKDIDSINNKFVNINEHGLRKNPLGISKQNEGLFLGGSTAFGYYASSDKKTIAALISKNTNYNFLNLNGPSWNSHQELISLIKHDKKYSKSISFSGNNDISIFCKYTSNTELEDKYIDAVEQFLDLNDVLKTIIEKQIYHINFFTLSKYFLVNNFPETIKIYSLIKKKIIRKNNLNLPINANEKKDNCMKNNTEINKKRIDLAVEKFIRNQELMRIISNSRNANHYLIIQPFFDLHVENESKDKKIYSYAFNKILKSEFCKKNCFDFSKIFNNQGIKVKSFLENFNIKYNQEFFIDRIHLSDLGNEIVVKEILKNISF